MKFVCIIMFTGLVLFQVISQSIDNESRPLTPEEKYLRDWLDLPREDQSIDLDLSVSGTALFQYGLRFSDIYGGTYTQGFLTVIYTSVDLDFIFYPDTFSNLNPRSQYRGIYAEILLSDFGVVISNDEGIDFWENYRIYDNLGNSYLPSQSADRSIVAADPEEEDSEYDYAMLYTGIGVTEPSIMAILHLTPHFYFQIANKPEIDNNLSTTLELEGAWAGVETENSGGFSLVWDYSRFNITMSAISQHSYDYEDPDDPDLRQDDEFGFSLEGEYRIGDFLRYNIYLSYLNFFSRDNLDSYFFVTNRGSSSVESIAAGGMSLICSPLESLEFGVSGDISYVFDGDFDRGVGTTDLINISGYVYDARIDLPLFYSTGGSIVISAGTYNYSFRNLVFNGEEQNKEYPLDLQLAISARGELWEFQAVVLAANCLNFQIEYEDYFLEDYQNLYSGFGGSFILGNPDEFYLSPGIALGYSLGRVATDGYNWDMTKNYVRDWRDDILGGDIFLEIGFPHTLMTLRYSNLQLLQDQKDIIYQEEFRTRDWGILTFTTEIFY